MLKYTIIYVNYVDNVVAGLFCVSAASQSQSHQTMFTAGASVSQAQLSENAAFQLSETESTWNIRYFTDLNLLR